MNSSLSDRLTQIRASLPSTVRLIAVTKRVSTDLMREAYAA